jgi:hypothetical protein
VVKVWVREGHQVLPDQDLPDTDGPGFVALNGRFGGACRSAGGHYLPVTELKFPPRSSRSLLAVG